MRKLTPNLIAIAVCVVHCLVGLEGAEVKTFTAEYDGFSQKDYAFLEVIGDAHIDGDALQLTPLVPDSEDVTVGLRSGRVLLKQPFRMWEENPNDVASLNTSFLFHVVTVPGEVSQGLAFVIAPDLLLPANSIGPFLGLTSSTTDASEANKLVAVELDTFKDDRFDDPDNNHVGIDVNSVRSVKTQSLTPYNITLNAVGAHFYNAWVDYDGVSRVIDVYIVEQFDNFTPPKPHSPVLSAPLNLRDHLHQYSYLGFSASTGYGAAFNVVLRWNLTVHHFSDPKIETQTKPLVLVLGLMLVLGLVLLVAAGIGYWFYKRKTASSRQNLMRSLKCLPGMPREFKFRDLKKATNNFNDKTKLGQGGFGVVYRGVLPKEKVEIAVKWFSRENIKGQLDFVAELTVINRLRHKHLVKLLGWCSKKGKLLLVYEYMPNSSLDRHLFVAPNTQPLPWDLRRKIIAGVASALHYLHDEYDHKVIHRDLKASNIMLDHDFNARLGDFGLAKVLDNEKTSYAEAEGVMGTMGYIAPECLLTGKATRQSDVYAFGAVLLEVVCGQRPGTKIAGFNFLVDWVWMLHRDNKLVVAVDERLGGEYVEEEALMLLLLGLACSHPNSCDRPKTQDIIQIVAGTMPAPAVPPFKPAFLWAAAVAQHTDSVDADGDSVNAMSITVSDLVR